MEELRGIVPRRKQMTRSRLPWVFRISAALIVAAVMVGMWWQPQAAGSRGRAFLATVARACRRRR